MLCLKNRVVLNKTVSIMSMEQVRIIYILGKQFHY